MKKFLLYLGITLLAVLLIGYIAAQFFLGSIVKAGVNQVGPKLTQSKIQLESATISPISGAGTLTGFVVGNPQGWSSGNALSVSKVHFDVQPSSFLKDTIVINDLSVDQPEFVYETHILSSNIGDLLKNIENAVGGSGKSEPAEKNAKPKKFIVKHFILQNGKVSVGVGAAAVPLVIPTVELKDLGVAEGGLTGGQLTFAVMRAVLPNIIAATTQAAGNLGGTMGAAAADALKKAGDSLQKMFGGKK
jgi:uncharacterized protein involved in outer membrane biogenesis